MRKYLRKIGYWNSLSRFSTATLDVDALAYDVGKLPQLKAVVDLIGIGAFEEAGRRTTNIAN